MNRFTCMGCGTTWSDREAVTYIGDPESSMPRWICRDRVRCEALVTAQNSALVNDQEPDLVNHPPHYTSHPSGVECIQVVEHMGFCLGNVVKYAWRADEKGDAIADLRKARWYLDREIAKREKEQDG